MFMISCFQMDLRQKAKCLLILTIIGCMNVSAQTQTDRGFIKHHHSKILETMRPVGAISPDSSSQDTASTSHNSRKVSRRSVPTGASVDTEAEKTLKTLFGKCSLSEDECNPKYKYRTFNGGCNNLGKPKTGATLTELPRLVPAEYDDNREVPRQKSIFRNSPLPNARLVSSRIHERLESSDNQFSLMMMQWGQFIDHDFAHTPQYKGPNNEMLDCKACDSAFKHLACYPILIPKEDKFFPRDNDKNRCMKFVRSLPSPHRAGPRQQMNAVTHFLDASQVYGSDICQAESLRDPGFKLKMTTNPASHPHSPRKDLLPMTPHKPECRAKDKMCFEVC